MRILLVEDEKRLVEALTHLLKRNGYVVDVAMEGDKGLEMAVTGVYDMLILDRMLPKRDGLSLLREFRGLGFDVPVLFLTAKDASNDRVEGLDAGADDYLIKPFSMDELFARLRALSRRCHNAVVGDILSVAGITLNPLTGEASNGKEAIKLTLKETLLLELLLRNYGQVITKARILEKVWGYYSEVEIGNVDLYIHYLRKKLNSSCIKTVRGIGYCLRGEQDA